MPSALDNFYKQQVAGPLNKVFLAGYIRDIATAENKWKAVFSVIKDIALFRVIWPVALLAGFTSMGKAIRSILHDTGSLDAALRRLQSIQGLQRVFTPLLGGLSAAKQRVAELVAFTDRNRLFPLEETAEASRKLEVFTRGTYSGSQALGEIQLASVQSGQGIADVADAVGHFYADLREGQPIDSAAESLRQMGVISQETAKRLVHLQQAGASVQDLMGDLRTTIGTAQPEGAGDDLATVQRRHEEAGTRLQEAFGKPFTQDEITNVKNYTSAMTAVTPVVGRVASFFALLTGGLDTIKSAMAKAAAESPVLQRGFEIAAKGVGVLLTGLALFAAYALPRAIIGMAGFVGGLTSLGRAAAIASTALRLIGIGTGVGLAIAAIATAAGVFINYRHRQEEAARAVRDLARAHREAQAAIDAQSASVESMADRNEALAKSMQNIIELEQKLADLRSGSKHTPERAQQEKEIQRAIDEAKAKQEALIAGGGEGLTGPALEQFITAQVERTRQLRRGAFDVALTKQAPEGAEAVMRAREAELRDQERQGEEGLETGKEVERVRQKQQEELAKAQQKQKEADIELGRREKLFPPGARGPEGERVIGEAQATKEAADEEVLKRQRAVAAVGLAAPKESSVFAESMAGAIENSIAAAAIEKKAEAFKEQKVKEFTERQAKGEKIAESELIETDKQWYALLQQSKRFQSLAAGITGTGQDIMNWKMYAAQQRYNEQNLPGISGELQQQRGGRERLTKQLNFQRTEEDLELEAHRLRRNGQSQRAEELDDQRDFLNRYRSNREAGMSDQESRDRAMKGAFDDIAESSQKIPPVIADSLQRIGGGGGSYGPGGDPMLRVAERQRKLLEESNALLKKIADKDMGVQ